MSRYPVWRHNEDRKVAVPPERVEQLYAHWESNPWVWIVSFQKVELA